MPQTRSDSASKSAFLASTRRQISSVFCIDSPLLPCRLQIEQARRLAHGWNIGQLRAGGPDVLLDVERNDRDVFERHFLRLDQDLLPRRVIGGAQRLADQFV